MSRDPHHIPPDDDLEAALHAFGLAEDAARATEREASDAAFAARVALWRDRMAELDETAEPVRTDPALWNRIEAALDMPERREAEPVHPFLADLWNSLFAWRTAAIGFATALAIAVGLMVLRPAPKPIMVAVLLTDTNRAAAVVDVYADGRVDLVPLETIPVPEDRILQVWTLWDRARGPVSLGLLDRARQARLPVSELPRTIPDQLFEITLEPRGGSPTGRPTGPILMKGTTSLTL